MLEPGTTINVNFGTRTSSPTSTGVTKPAAAGSDGTATIGLAFLVIIAAAGWLLYRRQRAGARV
jgi:LPXTG-motif cell wall-anchored protein